MTYDGQSTEKLLQEDGELAKGVPYLKYKLHRVPAEEADSTDTVTIKHEIAPPPPEETLDDLTGNAAEFDESATRTDEDDDHEVILDPADDLKPDTKPTGGPDDEAVDALIRDEASGDPAGALDSRADARSVDAAQSTHANGELTDPGMVPDPTDTVRIPVTIKHTITPPPEETPDDLTDGAAALPDDGSADDFAIELNDELVLFEPDPVPEPADGLTREEDPSGRDLELADDYVAAPDPWDWTIFGTNEGEIIVGTEGADVIWSLNGNDIISGLGGDDRIAGNRGDDVIDGGAGNDVLRGGGGSDIVTGGAGADIFEFFEAPGLAEQEGTDTFTDFDPAVDRLSFVDGYFAEGAGDALADKLAALPGADGAELWAENVDLGLMKIAVLEGVDAGLIQSMILDETILA